MSKAYSSMRSRAVVARVAHNHEVVGSIPTSATKEIGGAQASLKAPKVSCATMTSRWHSRLECSGDVKINGSAANYAAVKMQPKNFGLVNARACLKPTQYADSSEIRCV